MDTRSDKTTATRATRTTRAAASTFATAGLFALCLFFTQAAGASVTAGSGNSSPRCTQVQPLAVPAPSGQPGTTTETRVLVVVPAAATIQLDQSGEPAAVETNTGHPAACDDLFLVASTGGPRSATLSEINRVVAGESGTTQWHPGWNQLS